MAIKIRDDVLGKRVVFAVVVCMTAWTGMSISMAGLKQLPKCGHGNPDCFFFVQICDTNIVLNNIMNNNTESPCTWISKNRKVESNSGDGLDKVSLPIVASLLGVLPGITLVISVLIRNEKTTLGLLEFGKLFIGFDSIILIQSCMLVDSLTFDCRHWSDVYHPDSLGCEAGYEKYTVGSTIVFCTNFLLFCGTVVRTEVERGKGRTQG